MHQDELAGYGQRFRRLRRRRGEALQVRFCAGGPGAGRGGALPQGAHLRDAHFQRLRLLDELRHIRQLRRLAPLHQSMNGSDGEQIRERLCSKRLRHAGEVGAGHSRDRCASTLKG